MMWAQESRLARATMTLRTPDHRRARRRRFPRSRAVDHDVTVLAVAAFRSYDRCDLRVAKHCGWHMSLGDNVLIVGAPYSKATSTSALATCLSWCSLATSPMAQIPGTLVRICESTVTMPRLFVSRPTRSQFRRSEFGSRPVASSNSSTMTRLPSQCTSIPCGVRSTQLGRCPSW